MKTWLNGSYVDAKDAMISVDDRGFCFADGIYEVIRVYDGKPFMYDAHITRMRAGLHALQISQEPVAGLQDVVSKLINDNEVTGDGTVYIQITRGVAPRRHAFPAGDVKPTVYVTAKPFKLYPGEYFTKGVGAITVPDTRWTRCDIKSISLLPNVLANSAAHEQDAFEALFVKDGVMIEGSHSNLFGVIDGTLVTYPSCNYILSGISRAIVLSIARSMEIPTREGPILFPEHLGQIQELFLSGTTTEVMPVTTLNNRPVGTGKPGPVTARLRDAFSELTRQGG
jgi:D-alanine transaminase